MSKIKVAFICVHNSCRSQIAEAFGRHLASDVFQSYSAGIMDTNKCHFYITHEMDTSPLYIAH